MATVVRGLSAGSDATMVFLPPAPPCTRADLCAGVWHCCLPQVVSDWNYFPTLCSGGAGPLPRWCPAPAPAAAAAAGTTAAAAADKTQPVVGSSLAVVVDVAAGWSGAIGCMHSTPALVARETAPLRRRAHLLTCTSGAGGDGRGRGATAQGKSGELGELGGSDGDWVSSGGRWYAEQVVALVAASVTGAAADVLVCPARAAPPELRLARSLAAAAAAAPGAADATAEEEEQLCRDFVAGLDFGDAQQLATLLAVGLATPPDPMGRAAGTGTLRRRTRIPTRCEPLLRECVQV